MRSLSTFHVFLLASGPALQQPGVLTGLRLTAIVLLLRPQGPWFVRPALLLLAVLSLLSPRVLLAPATWCAAALLIGVGLIAESPRPDNHIYLLAYWCLACGLALLDADPRATLARASRWLLGAAFALAVLWKGVLSPDYMDGRFFRVTLLTDPRFADAARLFGGMSAQSLRESRRALEPLPEGAELLDPPQRHEPPRLRALAAMLTWGGLALEALVATAMLMPTGPRVNALRHAALLAFCGITYAFAPVAGFGWLLAVMGLAMCPPQSRALRIGYVVVFVLVLFYSEIPWTGLMLDYLPGAG